MTVRLTMGLGSTGKVITLYRTGKTLSLADANDIDMFTDVKNICFDYITNVNVRSFGAELTQETQRRGIADFQVAEFTAAQTLGVHLSEA
jgi:hypothetical protein